MPIALRLPIPGSDSGSTSAVPPTDWGDILNNFLQQTLINNGSGNGNGTLCTAATNPYTGSTNFNLATATYPGLVQLVGDLTGTAASPALASVITAGSVGSASAIPIITYDAKGRVTATSTAAVNTSTQRTFAFFAG